MITNAILIYTNSTGAGHMSGSIESNILFTDFKLIKDDYCLVYHTFPIKFELVIRDIESLSFFRNEDYKSNLAKTREQSYARDFIYINRSTGKRYNLINAHLIKLDADKYGQKVTITYGVEQYYTHI